MSQYIFLDHFSTVAELSVERKLSNIMFPDREAVPAVVWRAEPERFSRRTSLTVCPCQIVAEWPWWSVRLPGGCHSFPVPPWHVSPAPPGRPTSGSARLQRPHSRIKHTVYYITEALKSKREVQLYIPLTVNESAHACFLEWVIMPVILQKLPGFYTM